LIHTKTALHHISLVVYVGYDFVQQMCNDVTNDQERAVNLERSGKVTHEIIALIRLYTPLLPYSSSD